MRSVYWKLPQLAIPLAGAWLLALAALRVSWLWFPPGLKWPHLPSVAFEPYAQTSDFYSSTPQFIAPLFISVAAALIVEITKSSCLGSGDLAFYWGCVVFQCVVAFDILATAAPDWTVHALSLLLHRGTRPIAMGYLQSWPWPSLTALFVIIICWLVHARASQRSLNR